MRNAVKKTLFAAAILAAALLTGCNSADGSRSEAELESRPALTPMSAESAPRQQASTNAAPAPAMPAPAEGGLSWRKIDSGVEADLFAVHFPTAADGWAVGVKGLIIRTSDGGKSWIKQESGLVNADLRGVFFLDKDSGWACGGIGDGPRTGGHVLTGGGIPLTAAAILRTADGGKTWEKIWAPTNFTLTDIWMTGKDKGCVVSHGGDAHADGDTLMPLDGGKRWPTRRAFRALNAVQFVSDKVAFAAGTRVAVGFFPPPTDPLYLEKATRIITSADGGRTWKPCKHPDLPRPVMGLHFADEKNGWVSAQGGGVLHTVDGGETWELQDAGVKTDLRDVFAIDAKTAWLFGDGGAILKTSDAGKTWAKVDAPSGANLSRAWFTSAEHGVAVGKAGTILLYGK